jgi:hypothetical protein
VSIPGTIRYASPKGNAHCIVQMRKEALQIAS